MGPRRMCIMLGCPNYALETKDTCGGCTAGASIAGPALSAPSPAAIAAAEEMLRIPNALAAAVKTAEEVTKQMHVLCGQMELIAHLFTERQRATSAPPAKNYFLNEQHTTHVSKAQIRRERREAKARS